MKTTIYPMLVTTALASFASQQSFVEGFSTLSALVGNCGRKSLSGASHAPSRHCDEQQPTSFGRRTRLFAYKDSKSETNTSAQTYVKDTFSRLKHMKTQEDLGLVERQGKQHAGMPDLVSLLQKEQQQKTFSIGMASKNAGEDSSLDTRTMLIAAALALVGTTAVGLSSVLDLSPSDVLAWGHQFLQNPQESMQAVIEGVKGMGPAGPLYFGIIYLVAEILAVPATPLTLSAGYLFGLQTGTTVVLLAATVAASVAFLVGKTFLRTWVEEMLLEYPKMAKIDKAIGKEGFKLLLLVRLSPIFPFALSNYLYGASSIDFASYFFGTLLGFAPGTIAYVYTGMIGQALTVGVAGDTQPWYVYAGGLTLLVGVLKLVTDVATQIVDAIDDDDETAESAVM